MAEDRGVYRSNYTALFDDEDFKKLSPNTKLLLLTLKGSRLTNMAHIFLCDEGEKITLTKQTGLTLGVIEKAIQELIDTDWIAYQKPILWVRNGLKFEPSISLANPKHRSGVLNIVKSLPKLPILVKFCDYYELAYPFDTHSIPMRNTDTDHDTDTDTDNEQEQERVAPLFREIIEDLNQKAGKEYRTDPVSRGAQKYINGRMSEGFTVEDFKKVNTIKSMQWRGDAKMDGYLRPSTLYSPEKFEGYLNEHGEYNGDPEEAIRKKLELIHGGK